MFNQSPIHAKLNKEIIASLDELSQHESTSEEYGIVVDRLSKLYKLKSEERLSLPSPDTLLVVSDNLIGILMLTRY
jgi:hypothetical protein